jgi:peroxiredoxin/uncharacterized membrane protein YphA (DoxX/SURF4 family)
VALDALLFSSWNQVNRCEFSISRMLLTIALTRLALSVIFGIAGVTKLLDQPGTREAVANFGAPKSLAPAFAIILPFAEIAIALGLLLSATAWWSALGALLLLGLFVIAIGINLAQGNTHDCHCFGQIYSRPLGRSTLVRNVLFASAAVVVLSNPVAAGVDIVPTIASAFARLTTGQSAIVVAVVLAAMGALVYLQVRQKPAPASADNPSIQLPLTSAAPHFDLPAYDGGRVSLDQLLQDGKPVMLIFTNPNCSPCIHLFKEIKDWQAAHNDQLTIALISMGSIKDNFVNVAKNRLGQVLLEEKREVSDLYGTRATPTAVLINTEGRIASHFAAGGEDIRNLLHSIVGKPTGHDHHKEPLQHEHEPSSIVS